MKFTELPWQRAVCVSAKDGGKVLKCYEWRCQGINSHSLNPAWIGQPGDLHSWSCLNEWMNGNFGYNIMDHKLLLNLGGKFSRQFIISHVKCTKLPWQRAVCVSAKDGGKVLKCYERRCQGINSHSLNPAWTGWPGDLHSWSCVNEWMNRNFGYDIMDDILILNFGGKF